MSEKLKKALEKLEASDVEIDTLGRLVIKNTDIADKLKNVGIDKKTGLEELASNWGCCKNGIACGKKNVMDMM